MDSLYEQAPASHNSHVFRSYFEDKLNKENMDYRFNNMVSVLQILPTTGSFAKQHLLYPESVVISLSTPAGFYMRRTKYQSYQIQYTTGGHGRLRYDGKEYDLEEGDCFFIDCQKDHYFYTVGNEDWVHHGLQINGHQLPAIFQKFYKSGSVKVTPGTEQDIDGCFRKIAEAGSSKLESSDFILNSLLTELITQILLCNQIISDDQLSPKISGICSYIETNYTTIRNIDDIAYECFISKYYLCREFKRQTGKTIMEYLSGVRMNAAKVLLATTDIPVGDIASLTGYHSPNYFFAAFKAAENTTPLQYRKLWTSKG